MRRSSWVGTKAVIPGPERRGKAGNTNGRGLELKEACGCGPPSWGPSKRGETADNNARPERARHDFLLLA
jgi:hypothetical protein